jgi:hypothetical protein
MPVCPGLSGWYASIQCSTNFTLDIAQRTMHAMVELVACRFCLSAFSWLSYSITSRPNTWQLKLHQASGGRIWDVAPSCLHRAMAECPISCAVSIRPSCTRNSASQFKKKNKKKTQRVAPSWSPRPARLHTIIKTHHTRPHFFNLAVEPHRADPGWWHAL